MKRKYIRAFRCLPGYNQHAIKFLKKSTRQWSKKISAMLLCLLFFAGVQSQVTDTIHYGFKYLSSGSINKTNDGKSWLINNGVNFSARRNKNVIHANAAWIYGSFNRQLTNNDFSSAVDFNLYKRNTPLYFWGLGAFDKSYSLRVVSRVQAGAGAAYNVFNTGVFTLNLSDGVLYERNDLYLPDSLRDKYSTFRNSLRITYKINIQDLIVFDNQHFFQPSFTDGSDYIIKSTSSVAFRLRKWLSITAALQYNRVNRTKSENLLFTYGLTVEKNF